MLNLPLVRVERFELSTNGLKVRCSTDWATPVYNGDTSGGRTHNFYLERVATLPVRLWRHIILGDTGEDRTRTFHLKRVAALPICPQCHIYSGGPGWT